MARILDYPAVRQINSTEWELLESLEYHVGFPNSTEIILVPKGQVTDFASVPRWLWWLYPPFGRWTPGAVTHDYLYSKRGFISETQRYSRKRCDEIFLEMMEVMEVSWMTRHTMYRAVRLAGFYAWNR